MRVNFTRVNKIGVMSESRASTCVVSCARKSYATVEIHFDGKAVDTAKYLRFRKLHVQIQMRRHGCEWSNQVAFRRQEKFE